LHGMPYFIAPEEQTHVASLLWLDDNFTKGVDIEKLRNIANSALSHDNFFHNILGLMDVKTKTYDNKMDFIPYKN
ncbi:MAG: phosphoethanolamine transferase, partial [Candidatus Thioglobus sp.]